MSRSAGDPATQTMIEALAGMAPPSRPLVVDEPTGALARSLRALGGEPAVWLRHASPGAGHPATAWPTSVAHDAAFVRLPKSKEAFSLALHAAAALVPPGAPVAVFGANDEGIRSAASRLAEVADEATTVNVRHHARAVVGRRRATIDGLKGALAAWRHVAEITLAGRSRPWVSYPGTFAKGGLDDGTALLLAHLPSAAPRARILDFAAGTGVLAAAVLDASPDALVDMVDADAIAVAAAAENVPAASAFVGCDPACVADRRYDLVVSNPPIHDGVAESRGVLDRLVQAAPAILAPGGELRLVVQRRVPVLRALADVLDGAAVVADDGRFTVLAGRRR